MKRIAAGAEAHVYRDDTSIVKKRVEKQYRHSDLDDRLRRSRTRREARLLDHLSVAPDVVEVDDTSIRIEYVEGDLLTDVVEDNPDVMLSVGEAVSTVHNRGAHHGDLTTSNVILTPDPVIIDFGLGGRTERAEDKAVDIYLLRKAIISKHNNVFEDAWSAFTAGYDPEGKQAILERYHDVRKRGRYK